MMVGGGKKLISAKADVPSAAGGGPPDGPGLPPAGEAIRPVEHAVKAVYDFCAPTKTHYTDPPARDATRKWWGEFLARLGAPLQGFIGLRVLDVGCGSCEKATFYHDWGAKVTGLDISSNVLQLAREVVGERDVTLIQESVFDFQSDGGFDFVIADGVLHHTADTLAALKAALIHLRVGGRVIFSLVNVWGSFWWFRHARLVTGVLGGGDFHRKALWGRRLFHWLRRRQEATETGCPVFRSRESWAYDWFGNPRWNLHTPDAIWAWLPELGLEHLGSVPSLLSKESPSNWAARGARWALGAGRFMLKWYWLVNGEPNMVYVCAVKKATVAVSDVGRS